MVQAIRDRSIFWKFFHDGYEFVIFPRMKADYRLDESEVEDIMGYVEDFNQYLIDLDITIIELTLDWREMHRYCLRYSLETADAAHVLLAKNNSQYLVTIDTALIKARIREVKVLDPGDLLTRMELRFK